jgi:hypothetical protein
MGDAFYHALSPTDAGAYAKYAPTYIYHFDTLPGQNNTLSPKAGTRKRTKDVAHSTGAAFVFANSG